MLEKFTLTAEEWKNAMRMGGENAWINNDHPLVHPIPYSDHLFKTVEAAYKFAKFQQFPVENREFLSICLDHKLSAQEVRNGEHRLHVILKISEIWEEIRYGIMLVLNREKYLQNSDLAQSLMATHPHPIVEISRVRDRSGKVWDDRYWGVCVGEDGDVMRAEGCNAMGRIAMQIRDELRALSL